MNNTASQQNASSDRLRGCVDRVFFAGSTFSAGRVRTASGEFVPFSGNFYAQEGLQVVMGFAGFRRALLDGTPCARG